VFECVHKNFAVLYVGELMFFTTGIIGIFGLCILNEDT